MAPQFYGSFAPEGWLKLATLGAGSVAVALMEMRPWAAALSVEVQIHIGVGIHEADLYMRISGEQSQRLQCSSFWVMDCFLLRL